MQAEGRGEEEVMTGWKSEHESQHCNLLEVQNPGLHSCRHQESKARRTRRLGNATDMEKRCSEDTLLRGT